MQGEGDGSPGRPLRYRSRLALALVLRYALASLGVPLPLPCPCPCMHCPALSRLYNTVRLLATSELLQHWHWRTNMHRATARTKRTTTNKCGARLHRLEGRPSVPQVGQPLRPNVRVICYFRGNSCRRHRADIFSKKLQSSNRV